MGRLDTKGERKQFGRGLTSTHDGGTKKHNGRFGDCVLRMTLRANIDKFCRRADNKRGGVSRGFRFQIFSTYQRCS